MVFASCAYFNTYYNANLFFDEAEQMRAEHEGEQLANSIKDKYKSVVEKSDIVITKYSDSRYVDNAYLLKGQSHFYLDEFEESEYSFNTLSSINPDDYGLLSEYWLALIKWKKGRPQPALDDLNRLISINEKESELAKIYKSQADIYLELKQDSLALSALENAAELTKDRFDKGNIYFELAELADDIQNYEMAINHYENVAKYSYSNERVMEAHLRIVQHYRDLNRYKRASDQIQSMLNDPDFSSIYAELNLEFAKLDFSQNDNESAISKLDEIVVDFPKTEVSAEAFYLLGEEHLLGIRDFEKADYYYQQIQKEFNNSEFGDDGQRRTKELTQYNKSKDYLKKINTKISETDTTSQNTVIDTSQVVVELYNLGELEAFHFNQIDTSLIYFTQIINDYPNSELEAKTFYTLSVINYSLGDTVKSLDYEEQIINSYPDSEYAEHLRNTRNENDYGISNLQKLVDAEKLYLIDSELAINEYKNIANATQSEAACRALLFVANEYENKIFDADSARKYYELINVNYPSSGQANLANSRLRVFNTSQSDSLR